MLKPKVISGFCENLPEDQIIEDKFKDKIKLNYNLAGFVSLETTAIERIETLTSKGGDDNEIYKVSRLKGEEEAYLGLRFDLTVPLARYVSQHEGELSFPFKRQQIQKSWRGERPQKGRFREFYQADIDIIGNKKLPIFADIDILFTIYTTLKSLDFGSFIININNKKLLVGFLDFIGVEKTIETISIIDKKDKIKDIKPLFQKLGLTDEQVDSIFELLEISSNGNYNLLITYLDKINNKLFIEGLSELKEVYSTLLSLGINENYIRVNPSISRGLNYYTGTVFETFIKDAEKYGSISSGGRYDNLTENFSKNSYPGVGGSIGLTRLLSILKELNLLGDNSKKTITEVLILNLGDDFLEKNLFILKKLRKENINTEVFLDKEVKMGKQIKYADNKKIPYIIIFGEEEKEKGVIKLKKLETGEQKEIELSHLELLFNELKGHS